MDTMKCDAEKKHCCAKLCFKIAKLVIGAASVAVLVCMTKEIHRVHRAIDEHHDRKHIL